MKSKKAKRAAWRKLISRRRARSIARRLAREVEEESPKPVLSAKGIEYEVAGRERAIGAGGIGLMHRLVQKVGLAEAIDRRLQVLKIHLPYHESDHVLSLAYNILAGGTCIEDLERLRQDEGFLDALGADRIPDPTTAGDFCRRLGEGDVRALMQAVNEARLRVWSKQGDDFFDEAVIDADGTLVGTQGECKEGTDFAYDGTFGYHPLLVSLRKTQEPLFLVNRAGNRPSHEGAASELDAAVTLCREAGFRRIRLQGDTAFSQSEHLDRWDAQGVDFLFGWDATENLVARAAERPSIAWSPLERAAKYKVATAPRARPENVKDRVVAERGFKTIRTVHEEVTAFSYQPLQCARPYRLIVLKKKLEVIQGQRLLNEDVRHFFFITNDWKGTPAEIVLRANARADQENLIEQLKNGAKAMRMPVGDRLSNWAYMVMTSLAWTLKAWLALLLSDKTPRASGQRDDRKLVLRMEFKRFLTGFMQIPAQVVKTGRKIIFRLLSWNPLQSVFLRAADLLERPLRC